MSTSRLRAIFLSGIAAIAAVMPAVALAQATAASQGVEDIVVTATRRSERLQDVPIAVTAISAKALDAQNITNSVQIAQTTPGVVMARSLQNIQLSIRGITARASAMGDESSIAVYVDGIYQPTVFATAFELGKVERVEILRGPQGTLFGRNSTGGLVNIITPDPSEEWEGRVRLRYGKFDEKSLNANISGPISDKVGLDISGIAYDDDGYTRNLLTGKTIGARSNYAGRVKSLLTPTDDLRVTLTGSITRIKDQSAVMNQPLNRQTVAIQTPGAIIPTEPNTVALNMNPSVDIHQETAAAKVELDLGGVTFESTTSFQHSKLGLATDNDFSQFTRLNIFSTQTSNATTQEFRLLNQGAGRFKWTAGVFLFQDIGRYDPLTTASTSANVGGTTSTTTQFARNRTQSAAVYAEGTYEFTDYLKLLAGGRYSWERRHFTATRTAGVPAAPLDKKANFEKFTPRVSLMATPAEHVNAYLTYSKGFKSGVFNTTGLNPVPVKPEQLEMYEAGLKTDPTRWLRANFAVFHYHYTDFQVTGRNNDLQVLLLNAGAARINGAEMELTASPINDLNLRFSASTLSTKFTDFANAQITLPNANGTDTSVIASANGKKLQRAPKFTFNAGIDYGFDVAGVGRAGFSANLYHSSKYYWEFANRLVQNGYEQLGGQVWLEPKQGLRIGVWGDNLTNSHVLQQALATALGDNGVYNKPRSYGVFANLDF